MQHPAFTRIAEHVRPHIYIDLGGPAWNAVEIGHDGISRRRRPTCVLPACGWTREFPVRVSGGDIELLRSHENIADVDEFVLLVGWLVGSIAPKGPFPVLAIKAE
ncbi:MAG: hypothetical protein ACM3NQ_20305 [Bacteroidales bacterium]